jgi:hypothetical protein
MSVKQMTNEENSMFVGTPVWERAGKKRRGHSAPKVVSRPAVVTEAPRTVRASKTEPAPAPAMTRTTTAKRRSSSVAQSSAIALGVIIVAGVGAGAWYATQNRQTGVAQLTPGVATAPVGPANTTEVAANTAAPPPAVTPQPATSASQRVTPARTVSARTRPAAAASAEGSAVDTSATLPDGPMPYSKAAPDAAAATPTPAAAAAATPAPTEAPADVIAPPAAQVAPPQ